LKIFHFSAEKFMGKGNPLQMQGVFGLSGKNIFESSGLFRWVFSRCGQNIA